MANKNKMGPTAVSLDSQKPLGAMVAARHPIRVGGGSVKRESMFWLAAFVAAESLAGAFDGPIFRRLRSAASASLAGGGPERQSEQSGVPFSESPAATSVQAHAHAVMRKAREPETNPALKTIDTDGLNRVPSPADDSTPESSKPKPLEFKSWGAARVARAVGTVAAGAGLGLFAYAVAAGTAGPVGWAAALVFFGGMAVYLARRPPNGRSG